MTKVALQKVVLIGPMGVGKTTIGKLLAQSLNWTYIDNDAEISALTGLSAEKLSKLPVNELHKFESQYLANLCHRDSPFVGGAAGSVVDFPDNIETLKTVTAIYLRIPMQEVVARAGSQGIGRGNISGELNELLRERYRRRDPLYCEVAKFTLNLSDNPVEDSNRILAFLEGK